MQNRYTVNSYPQPNKGGQQCCVSIAIRVTDNLTGNEAICSSERTKAKNVVLAIKMLQVNDLSIQSTPHT